MRRECKGEREREREIQRHEERQRHIIEKKAKQERNGVQGSQNKVLNRAVRATLMGKLKYEHGLKGGKKVS